jgi:hypothetical protein
MLTPEERALLIDKQDQLIELLVQRDEAVRAADRLRVQDLQSQIEKAQGQVHAIRRLATAGAC